MSIVFPARRTFPLACIATLTTLALATLSAPAHAEIIFGITNTTALNLVSFDSATPGTLLTSVSLSGLTAGHDLRSIDFRPSNGQLYALSNLNGTADAQLYTVNLTTGALTTVGGPLSLTGNVSNVISLDFNPVVDALRVVTGGGQNYRVNPNTGALIAQDTNISPFSTYAGIAYSNNVAGAASTTLYAYDYINDAIGTIGSVGGTPNSPNSGLYSSIGSSGITAADPFSLGFDISGATGTAYIAVDSIGSADPNSELYTVNLGTGALSLAGNFNTTIVDISVRPVLSVAGPEPASLALFALGMMVGASRIRRRARTRFHG